MGIKFDTSKLEKQLRGAMKHFDDHGDKAVEDTAQDIYDETQVRVPKETGALAGTGRIERNTRGPHEFSRSIWYGEPGEGPEIIDYAAAVHEILDAQHASPTGPKYVEQPLIEAIPDFKKTVAEEMQKAVKEAFK